jgi:phospholipase C
MKVSSVRLARTFAGFTAALLLGGGSVASAQQCPDGHLLPQPSTSGIQHIVFIVMENRSFDHLLGWRQPGPNPQQQTYEQRTANGTSQWSCSTYPLNATSAPADPHCQLIIGGQASTSFPNYTGTGNSGDPDHAIDNMSTYYNGGAMNGWLFKGFNASHYGIGYYLRDDAKLPELTKLATTYTVLDQYFAPMVAQSDPNRMYEHTATTDRHGNFPACDSGCTNGISSLHNIWDLLGTTGKYYYEQEDYLAMFWGNDASGHQKYPSHPYTEFITDVNNGNLAPVSVIDAFQFHPPQDITNSSPISSPTTGDSWLASVVEPVLARFGSSTVIVITFDEGGGFFDHVIPPHVHSVSGSDADSVGDGGIAPDADGKVPVGARLPTIVVSPFSPNTFSSFGGIYDHTSVLKMIEWRFLNGSTVPTSGNRPPGRDANGDMTNLACALTLNGAPPPGNVVVYASDIPQSAIHGNWFLASDPASPNTEKLATPVGNPPTTDNALAAPADYVDVTFTAAANVPYTLWLRVRALNNAKASDSLWVQFSDALLNGSGTAAYPWNTTSGLLVNLATDTTGNSDQAWGWVNGAYWLSQPATVTFATTGVHTLRIQPREYGVEFDQIVLSPSAYFNPSAECPTACTGAPGPVSNDQTIVPKPGSQPPATPGSPNPASAATNVSTSPTLTWSAAGATTYDVYFGTSNPPPSVTSGQTGTSYAPGTLTNATTYYWNVVAHNAAGTASGPIWSFTTSAAPSNLLVKPGFEEYAVPSLGAPGWVSDRTTPAKSETNQPHSGAQNGACWATDGTDCGMYQDVSAAVTGTYVYTVWAAADVAGGLVGANVNGSSVGSSNVNAQGFGVYQQYSVSFSAQAGDVIRVWMYSPAIAGNPGHYVVIDDASVAVQ